MVWGEGKEEEGNTKEYEEKLEGAGFVHYCGNVFKGVYVSKHITEHFKYVLFMICQSYTQ